MSAAISGMCRTTIFPDIAQLYPHIAEPVIGRAFARPVGSCGLQDTPYTKIFAISPRYQSPISLAVIRAVPSWPMT
jgi:hypothetical protein